MSSFGIGGTNAHAILEEAPARDGAEASRPWQLLIVSAKTLSALDHATANLVEHLRGNPEINFADVAFTLQVGRRSFDYRRAVVCRDAADAAEALEQLDPRRVSTGSVEDQKQPIAFMFTGQGSQYPGMGAGLYEHEPVFRYHVDECAELLKPHLGCDLRDVIYPRRAEAAEAAEAAQVLTQTSMTQPALFVIEYALAQLLMKWGIQPEVMIGHSIGEYVAACLAGVFSLEDALALVAERGRLMQQMPAGSMLSVRLTEAEVRRYLNNELDLAVVNAPSQCVVAGPNERDRTTGKDLAAHKVDCTRLHTSHAFHSAMMQPVLAPFTEKVKAVGAKRARIPVRFERHRQMDHARAGNGSSVLGEASGADSSVCGWHRDFEGNRRSVVGSWTRPSAIDSGPTAVAGLDPLHDASLAGVDTGRAVFATHWDG